jgi:hypothetical protein
LPFTNIQGKQVSMKETISSFNRIVDNLTTSNYAKASLDFFFDELNRRMERKPEKIRVLFSDQELSEFLNGFTKYCFSQKNNKNSNEKPNLNDAAVKVIGHLAENYLYFTPSKRELSTDNCQKIVDLFKKVANEYPVPHLIKTAKYLATVDIESSNLTIKDLFKKIKPFDEDLINKFREVGQSCFRSLSANR